MYDITLIIPVWQFEQLMELLPNPRQRKRGRKRCSKSQLLMGILQVLKTGIRWRDIHEINCSGSSCYRYFRELQRRGIPKKMFHLKAYGKHKRHGTKISLLADINDLPADVIIDTAKVHDGKYCDQHIKNTRGRRKRILNLDKIYTSAKRRRRCRQNGIKINMEIRRGDYTRKRGPKFSWNEEKYAIRFKVERTFSWLESYKRVRHRVDRHLSSYRGFVYLALLIISVRS